MTRAVTVEKTWVADGGGLTGYHRYARTRACVRSYTVDVPPSATRLSKITRFQRVSVLAGLKARACFRRPLW